MSLAVIIAWMACTLLAMGWWPCGCCGITCGECCPSFRPSIIVDLGVGGWTDSICTDCELVAGEWEIPYNVALGGVWPYGTSNRAGCGYHDFFSELFGDCSIDPGSNLKFEIRATLTNDDCQWQVAIVYDGSGPFFPVTTRAYYESAANQCTFPVELTKVSEIETVGNGPCDISGGGLPTTIYLRAA